MSNKKYKLANNDYWATDGVYDLGQSKTQRQINSDVNSAINSLPVGKVFHVGTGQTYTTLRAGLEAATQQKNSVVYVHTGTYDLTQEFATELSGNMSSYTGLKPYNGVHIIGEAGAVVTAIFDTVDVNRYMFFSPFVAVSEHDGSQYAYCDFTIENLTIKSKDCRYCVHDDPYGQGTYTHKYINCIMENTNTMTGQSNAIYIPCIGGGLGEHSTIIVDGGTYKASNSVALSGAPSTNETQCAISYHNSNYSATVQSTIIIKDVVLLDYGFFRFQAYGSSPYMTNVYIINCKTGLPTVKGIIGNATDNVTISEYNENPFTPKSKLQKRNLVTNWLMDEGGSIDGTYLPINQRGQTSYTSSGAAGTQIIDGWKLAFYSSCTLVDRATGVNNGYDAGYLDITLGDGTHAGQLAYTIEVPIKSLEGMEMTLSILTADGTMYTKSGITAKNASAATNSLRLEIGNCVGMLYQPKVSAPVMIFNVDAGKTQNLKIRAVKLEFGLGQTLADYDAASGKYIIQDPFPDKAALLNAMQRYYQLYTTSAARPSSRIDCRPIMYKTPTQGTVTIGGTTYYYNDAAL